MTTLIQYYKLLKEQHDADHEWWPTFSENPRFEVMTGCILTQNTNWENAEKAIENLYNADLLDEEKMLKVAMDDLKRLIRPSGYYNQKANRLKRLARFLESNPIKKLMEQDAETLREQLLNIKGVGKETADSILLFALDKPIFVIDAYTKRVVSRWGELPKDVSYEELQKFFTENLPEDVNLYKEYHALIVEHAKIICKPNPLCEACNVFDACEKNI